ncbi:MAG: hypothetical protein ACYTFG_02230 [Planctomycetota bacterium]|jgi:hypothetical protein
MLSVNLIGVKVDEDLLIKAREKAEEFLEQHRGTALEAADMIRSHLAMLDSDELFERDGFREGRMPREVRDRYEDLLSKGRELILRAEAEYQLNRAYVHVLRQKAVEALSPEEREKWILDNLING